MKGNADKIETIYSSDGDSKTMFARGHLDNSEFYKHLEAYGLEINTKSLRPNRTYFKAVPSRNEEFNCFYHEVNKDCRGAFPVTHLVFD